MARLLVFDWDGTLMDSEVHIVNSMQAAILDLGLPERSKTMISNIIGLGLTEAIRTLYPEHLNETIAQEMAEAYRGYYFNENAPQQLFTGAISTIEKLIARNYVLAIATGKSRKGLDLALEETGLNKAFEMSRCADETTSKPDPHMLNEIMTTLKIDKSETIMIGDTEYDMEMAYNAGTMSIAARYGVHDTERLLKHNPTGYIENITDLPDALVGLAEHRQTDNSY